jgi:hypothetical protein
MQPNVTRTGKLALRQGLLFGLSLGIFFIMCNVMLSFAKLGILLAGGIYSSTNTSTGHALGSGGPLVEILVYLVAGVRTSRQTGRVATGTLAGVWTGLISAGMTFVYTIVFVFASGSLGQNSASGELFAILAPLVGILGIGLAVGLGAGIGALGGLIGKRRASPPTQFFQQSMFFPARTPQNRQ